MGQTEFLKCPCCGRLAEPVKMAWRIEYPLELKIRKCLGRGHIEWETRTWKSGERQYLAEQLYWRMREVALQLKALAEITEVDPELSLDVVPEIFAYVQPRGDPASIDIVCEVEMS